MTDHVHLLDITSRLIEWNPASRKWQDQSNDYYCSNVTGKWQVTARRGFENGQKDILFDEKTEALQFFVNYLFGRRMRMAMNERAELRDLIDRRFEVVQWDSTHEKWRNDGNDFFCAPSFDGSGWRVDARYNFSDGRDTLPFDYETDAFEFFVNFLFARMMSFTREATAA